MYDPRMHKIGLLCPNAESISIGKNDTLIPIQT